MCIWVCISMWVWVCVCAHTCVCTTHKQGDNRMAVDWIKTSTWVCTYGYMYLTTVRVRLLLLNCLLQLHVCSMTYNWQYSWTGHYTTPCVHTGHTRSCSWVDMLKVCSIRGGKAHVITLVCARNTPRPASFRDVISRVNNQNRSSSSISTEPAVKLMMNKASRYLRPAWYVAFDHWATTCESVDSCNIGVEQKRHRRSFLTFAAGHGPAILSAKWAGLSEKPR